MVVHRPGFGEGGWKCGGLEVEGLFRSKVSEILEVGEEEMGGWRVLACLAELQNLCHEVIQRRMHFHIWPQSGESEHSDP